MNRQGGFHFNFGGFATAALVLAVAVAAVLYINGDKNFSLKDTLLPFKEPTNVLKVTDAPRNVDASPTLPTSKTPTPSSLTPEIAKSATPEVAQFLDFVSKSPEVKLIGTTKSDVKANFEMSLEDPENRLKDSRTNTGFTIVNGTVIPLSVVLDEIPEGQKIFKVLPLPGAIDQQKFNTTRHAFIIAEMIKRGAKFEFPKMHTDSKSGGEMVLSLADWKQWRDLMSYPNFKNGEAFNGRIIRFSRRVTNFSDPTQKIEAVGFWGPQNGSFLELVRFLDNARTNGFSFEGLEFSVIDNEPRSIEGTIYFNNPIWLVDILR